MAFDCPPLKVELTTGTGSLTVDIDEAALATAIAMAVGRSMDLEVVCDVATGDRIFVRMETDDAGVSTYTNPVTGAAIVPGTDFVPCGTTADIDVEWHRLCDDVNGDGSLLVPFRRMTIATTDAAGAPVSLAPLDFEIDTATAYAVQGDVVECDDCEPVRDDGLCAVERVTATVDWAVTAANELTINSVALPNSADVRYYRAIWGDGSKDIVFGSGPIAHTYAVAGVYTAYVVVNDGENNATVAVTVDVSDATLAGVATLEILASYEIIRKVDCDGVTSYVRCLTGADFDPAGATITKCSAAAQPDLPVLVSKTCYVTKAAAGTRVLWDQSQAWDAGNPTIAAAGATLVGGAPVTFVNVMNSGLDVTITPMGTLTAVDYFAVGTFLRVTVPAGSAGGLTFDYLQPQCAAFSGGPVDDGDTLEYNADGSLLVTDRPDIPGSVVPIVAGNNSTSPTVTGQAGDDQQLVSGDDLNQISFSYTNNAAGAQNFPFGMSVNGSAEYWCEEEYSDGSTRIISADGTQEAATVGAWQRIDCDFVPPVQGTAALLQELVDCLCPTTATGLDTELMLGALTAPTAPAETREVTVQNYSAATVRITTAIGDQVVGPNGVIEFGVRADEPALTLTAAAVVTGTFGIADQLIFNYRTEA